MEPLPEVLERAPPARPGTAHRCAAKRHQAVPRARASLSPPTPSPSRAVEQKQEMKRENEGGKDMVGGAGQRWGEGGEGGGGETETWTKTERQTDSPAVLERARSVRPCNRRKVQGVGNRGGTYWAHAQPLRNRWHTTSCT